MIVAHILGGLGNQMFQFAAGRALSLARGTPLRLDIRDYNRYRRHAGFELNRVFELDTPPASRADLRAAMGWRACEPLRRALKHRLFAPLRGSSYVVEPHKAYWDGFTGLPADCYLYGYWQSARYFEAIAPTLRRDFSFRGPLDRQAARVADRMAASRAVSLHVRRGDYATHAPTRAFHGLCLPDYYRRAAEYIAARVEHPAFYIFSDDMPWVRRHLELGWPCEYVESAGVLSSGSDMRLMSLCDHHIICNSSFSWWGAWLNPSQEKIVVAPRQWFAVDMTHDIVPSEWITL